MIDGFRKLESATAVELISYTFQWKASIEALVQGGRDKIALGKSVRINKGPTIHVRKSSNKTHQYVKNVDFGFAAKCLVGGTSQLLRRIVSCVAPRILTFSHPEV